jgi:hypothetical protein
MASLVSYGFQIFTSVLPFRELHKYSQILIDESIPLSSEKKLWVDHFSFIIVESENEKNFLQQRLPAHIHIYSAAEHSRSGSVNFSEMILKIDGERLPHGAEAHVR